jgi:serine/threonine protein kinase
MSPEVIESKGNMSPACDIWSLGCTIIELLTGQPPYFNLELYGAMFRIVSDEHPPLPEGISETLYDFFKKCFVKDPEKRSTARELLRHPWIISPNKNFPTPIMIKENKENKENFGNIFNAALFSGHQKERSNSGASSHKNKSVDSGHQQAREA